MKIEVLFYAQLKDFFGDSLVLDLAEPATVATLMSGLAEKNALAADWLKVSRVANDDVFLAPEAVLNNSQRYYVLPPSSGG